MLDWTKGEVLAPVTCLALMVGAAPTTDVVEEERDIWEDTEVLNFILTHKYHDGLSAKSRDRIYRRAKSYRWMGDGVMRLLQGGAIVVVPRQADRQEIVVATIKAWDISECNGSSVSSGRITGGGIWVTSSSESSRRATHAHGLKLDSENHERSCSRSQ